jgi:hypothetical protein
VLIFYRFLELTLALKIQFAWGNYWVVFKIPKSIISDDIHFLLKYDKQDQQGSHTYQYL